MANEDLNPRLAARFRVEIDGITIGEFTEFDPEDSSFDSVEDRTGTDPDHMNVSQGLWNTQRLVFRKVARDHDNSAIKQISDWHEAGESDKRGGAVTYLDKEGNGYHRVAWYDGICTNFKRPSTNATDKTAKAMFEFTVVVPRTTTVY